MYNCYARAAHRRADERFLPGNALKYLWRAGKKGDFIEDVNKAQWYLDYIERMYMDA